MVIAQKDTVRQTSWCKLRPKQSLYDFASDQRRQDSLLKAGPFCEYFYQQQEMVSQCSSQTTPMDLQITRLVLS